MPRTKGPECAISRTPALRLPVHSRQHSRSPLHAGDPGRVGKEVVRPGRMVRGGLGMGTRAARSGYREERRGARKPARARG